MHVMKKFDTTDFEKLAILFIEWTIWGIIIIYYFQTCNTYVLANLHNIQYVIKCFLFYLADILKIPAISSHCLKYFVKLTFQVTNFA